MRRVKDKSCIQIEITNACTFSCTNCYKFIGHHAKPHFMGLETIKKSIDSLEGYKGRFGITGGEPTLHPDFPEICRYLRRKVPPDQRYLQTTGFRWHEYKSLIKETFADRVLYNDHKDKTQKHHPMLVAIRDVIEDHPLEKKLIDNCWVKEKWSAVINSKGCFICEIAGAFDTLYNGPGGHPITKGWWLKSNDFFNDQLERYCYQCGAALPQTAVTNNSQKDLVSISNFQKLEKLKTPKFRNNRILLFSKNYSTQEIKNISIGWKPWQNKGIEGEKDILKQYGAKDSYLLKVRRRLRKRFNIFRRNERRIGRLFWRFSQIYFDLTLIFGKVILLLKKITDKLRSVQKLIKISTAS